MAVKTKTDEPILDEPEGTMIERMAKAKEKEGKKVAPPENK